MREFELLSHIFQANSRLPGLVLIPPGDDMAFVELGGKQLLAAVDQIVDGRHVRVDSTPIELVGRKAITRCLSDVAAMAGRPTASLAAVTLPPDFGEHRARSLFEAMHAAALQFNCPLIGGDVAFHPQPGLPLVCSVTVLAEPGSTPPITRSGARAGDGLYVTGALGGAWDGSGGTGGGGRHLSFSPRIDEALALAEALRDRLHAMIDISDGLGRDASHIAELSNVAIEIEAARIPCSPGCDWRRAVSDGEDYELCFAAVGDVPQQILGLPTTRVGRVIGADQITGGRVIIIEGSHRHRADELGWQHESPPALEGGGKGVGESPTRKS